VRFLRSICAGLFFLLSGQIVLADTFSDPSAFHRELASHKATAFSNARHLPTAGAASLEQLLYDVTYYDLDITVQVSISQVAGAVYMEAQSLADGLTQFDVDLYLAMSADSVFMDGAPVAYSHVGSELFITPQTTLDSGDVFNVTVYYHGSPASGGFGAFGFSTHGSPAEHMIWTLSEPYYARNWWPCKDTPSEKADSMDIHITCPDHLFASSNGRLISEVDNGDGTKTFDWHHGYPIASYLVSMAISDFTQLDYMYTYNGGADSMPVHFWVYPERVANAEASYPEILQMLAALEPLYGPYPFRDEMYAISHFAWGGGMEHQTNTSQSSSWYSWALNSHELGHQWWGDWVTLKTWQDIWLNEGFASFTEALYLETQSGQLAYQNYMNGMAYKGGGTIYVDDTTSVGRIFSGGLSYDKGAWAVHMLRGVLGDPVFFAAIAEYRSRYGGASADTDDFKEVCEDVSGLDLSEYFNDWIHGTYYPKYIYSFYAESQGSEFLGRARVEQIQVTQPQVFDMPVKLTWSDGVNTLVTTVQNDQRVQWFDVTLPFRPTSLILDKQDWILKDRYEGVSIDSDTLKSARRDEVYADTLVATGSTPPFSWTAVSLMPPGLTLASNGTVSGTPAVFGTFAFTAHVASAGSPQTTMERELTLVVTPPLQPEGDVTNDGVVTSADIVALVNYVFKSGPAPVPIHIGDVNSSCAINAGDIIYLVNYVFKGGTQPLEGCAT